MSDAVSTRRSHANRRVALIRGINVGRAKRIAMADLRALFESLGYEDVSTLLNSGNVVFTVPRGTRGNLAAGIETGIASRTGVSARVSVLKASELIEIVNENPFARVATDPSRLMVTVLIESARTTNLGEIVTTGWGSELVAVGARAVYSWCPDGVLKSPLTVALGKALRDGGTTRNWSTILKLRAAL